MLNNKDSLVAQLQKLNLSADEAKVYLELLREPSTHSRISHDTGVNRTKVYRLVEQLEKRSLISRYTDDRGTFLVAADPSTLEVTLITSEEILQRQREAFDTLMPTLVALQNKDSRSFVVRTYEGQAGFKQMCWHELKTEGELLSLGYGTIEALVGDNKWADRHRTRQVAANYQTRELANSPLSGTQIPEMASRKLYEAQLYDHRLLSPEILLLDSQTVIYNDTVAIYHWRYNQKVGIEIISSSYTDMMRQLFEYYWRLAGEVQ